MTSAFGATTRLHGRELRRIAAGLGHEEQNVWEAPNGRFFSSCSCGWTSTQRLEVADALGAAVNHVVSIAKPLWDRARRNGQNVQRLVDASNARPREAPKSAQQPGWQEWAKRVA